MGSAAVATESSKQDDVRIGTMEKPIVVFPLLFLSILAAGAALVLLGSSPLVVFGVLTLLTLVIWLLLRADRATKAQLVTIKENSKKERERFIALMNTLDTAVIATDNQGRITLYNQAALAMLNTHATLTGQYFITVFKLQTAKAQQLDIIHETAEAKRTVQHADLKLPISANETLQLQVTAAPIAARFGSRGGGFVVVLRDITKAKSLDDERNEFVSVTSHELRTPVAVVEAGLATVLAEPMRSSLKPEAAKLLTTLHDRIVHLGQLVQDLSTLAKAQGEFLDIEIKPIDPHALVTQVKVAHQDEASQKDINLLLHPMLELHPVLTSPTYVHEILENFLSNAIKYTKSGGVVSMGAENVANNAVRFWVEDSGIGISTSDQKKLFTKFFRAEDFHTRETEGTGLGLYITKKMAERIGAKVWCVSELGKGSIFFLEVPPVGGLQTDAQKVTTAEIEDFANAI